MSVRDAIVAELEALGASGWRAEAALLLAGELDATPNASMARELRSLMNELGSSVVPVSKPGDVGDDLRSRRDARIAAAAG